jgi:hypothetical protein
MAAPGALKARRSKAQGEGGREACSGTLGWEWDSVKPCKGGADSEISLPQ